MHFRKCHVCIKFESFRAVVVYKVTLFSRDILLLPSGVSGGQKKRVTIAEASLSRPVISFYDGYTKGLDSATALGLAQGLSAVCWNSQGGRTVIASQYQASQEIFEIFDKVLVLQKEDDPDAPSQMV